MSYRVFFSARDGSRVHLHPLARVSAPESSAVATLSGRLSLPPLRGISRKSDGDDDHFSREEEEDNDPMRACARCGAVWPCCSSRPPAAARLALAKGSPQLHRFSNLFMYFISTTSYLLISTFISQSDSPLPFEAVGQQEERAISNIIVLAGARHTTRCGVARLAGRSEGFVYLGRPYHDYYTPGCKYT